MNTFLYSVIFYLITTVTFSQNVEWQIFTGSNSGLPDEYVLTLAIESNGTKWIGTGNGLASFDGNNWNVYTSTNSPLPYNWVSAIDLSGNGELWIGTFGGGLAKLEGSVWTIYTDLITGVPISTIRSVATRGRINVKLFGTSYEGLAVFDGADWSIFNTSNSDLPYNTVGAVAIEGPNLWWVGTDYGFGLARYDGDWTIYNSGNSGLPFSPINSIAIDSAGTKWIGTDVGLTSFDGNMWTTYTSSNSGFPGGTVTGIAVDSINNIWLATAGVTGGLVKFDGTDWTLYNISNTGIWNYLRSIAVESNGNVWVGTNGYGLAVLNENGLTSVEQISGEPNNFQLSQNYPNPFNPSTKIKYSIPTESFVKLTVYNAIGEAVAELVNQNQSAGTYEADFSAGSLSSGIYFYTLSISALPSQDGQARDPSTGSGQVFIETKKMILLK